jgi:putative endonuclease
MRRDWRPKTFALACVTALRDFLSRLRRGIMPWDGEWRLRAGESRATPRGDAHRADRGRAAEEAVARHLWLRGYKIVARNIRNRFGEIDVVAEGEGRLHFIEVRSYAEGQSRPSGRLTRDKRRSIYRAAARYLSRRRELAEVSRTLELAEVRFDADGRVVSVDLLPIDVTDFRWR